MFFLYKIAWFVTYIVLAIITGTKALAAYHFVKSQQLVEKYVSVVFIYLYPI